MADISITAAAVVAGTGAQKESGIAGATVTAGQVVYKDTATGKYLLADSDSATAIAKIPRGIALNGAALNQPLAIIRGGNLTMNAALIAGTAYYLSDDTPGGIAPLADIGVGDNVVQIGLASSTTVLVVDLQVPGVTL